MAHLVDAFVASTGNYKSLEACWKDVREAKESLAQSSGADTGLLANLGALAIGLRAPNRCRPTTEELLEFP
jgi:hypothetical protein